MTATRFAARFCEDRLQKIHPCPPFDDHITFDDRLLEDGTQLHDYYVDGEKCKGSVTGFVHHFFPSFDEDKVIQRMMSRSDWELNKYYGMTSTQIKQYWKDIRDEAAELGTRMHAAIEWYYNADEAEKEAITNEHPTPEFDYFLDFHKTVASNWVPWRTELRVFDKELQMPGSVDMLYWSPRSTPTQPLLIMYDWKRSKDILREPIYDRGHPPLSHMPDTKLAHYQLQLNVYKALIERNTEYRIESMALGVFHPTEAGYLSIPIPEMKQEMEAMFRVRVQQLNPSPPPPPVKPSRQPSLLDLFHKTCTLY